MSRMIFVNLPVKNVKASREFFAGLGFDFNDQFSDEHTASMIVNDQAIVMLLEEAKFKSFIRDDIADTSRVREVLVAVSADSKDDVNTTCDKALSTGGSAWTDPQDHGFMYGRSFLDLDNHVWEVIWMDPAEVSGEH
ncbi:MAG: VOC family protein [Rhodococcus sp. (in: high G+C Gram-positive bacteria)]